MRGRLDSAIRFPEMKLLVDFDDLGFNRMDEWEDITEYVTDVSGSVEKESELLGGVSSDIFTFTLDNSDNTFSNHNPFSPLYKKLKSKIRFVLKTGFRDEELHDSFIGYVQKFDPSWRNSEMLMKTTCPMDKLKRTPPPKKRYQNVQLEELVKDLLTESGIDEIFELDIPKTPYQLNYFRFEEENCFVSLKNLAELSLGQAYFEGKRFRFKTKLAIDYEFSDEAKHIIKSDDAFEFDEVINDSQLINDVEIKSEYKVIRPLETIWTSPEDLTRIENEKLRYDGGDYLYVDRKNLPLYWDEGSEDIEITNITKGIKLAWEVYNAELGRIKLSPQGIGNIEIGDVISLSYTYQPLVILPGDERKFSFDADEDVYEYNNPDVVAWNSDATEQIPYSVEPDFPGSVSLQKFEVSIEHDKAEIVLKNNTNDKAVLSTLQLRGFPVRSMNPIEVYNKDRESIKEHDTQKRTITNDYINNIKFAEEISQFIISNYSQPRMQMDISINGYPELLLDDISEVKDTRSEWSDKFVIERIDYTFNVSNGWTSNLTLIELDDVPWEFDEFEGESFEVSKEQPVKLTPGDVEDMIEEAEESKYPDHLPPEPENVWAEGGFEVIQVYWDYADYRYIKKYEVFGSQEEGFVPNKQSHLLWSGDVSAFAHKVKQGQTWYYRVRGVNTHGNAGPFSAEVSAGTAPIMSDDILFGEDLAEKLRELSKIADIIDEVSWDQVSEEAKNMIEYNYTQYTDQEIKSQRQELMDEIADKAGFDWVENQLIDKVDYNEYTRKVNDLADDIADKVDGEWVDGRLESKADADSVYVIEDIDDMFDNVVSILEYRTDKDGFVERFESAESRLYQNEEAIGGMVKQTEYDALEREINQRMSDWEQTADGFRQSVANLRSDFDGMELGGRNILRYTDFSKEENTDQWVSIGNAGDLRPRKFEGFPRYFGYLSVSMSEVGVHPRIRTRYGVPLIKDREYTLSWTGTTSDFVDRDFVYSGILGADGYFVKQFFNIEKKKVGETEILGYTKNIYKYHVTFTFEGETAENYALMFGSTVIRESAPWIVITDVMLEHGNVAGEWNIAPEDTDEVIGNVRDYASSIEQTAKGIVQDVSKLEVNVDDHGRSIDDVQSTLEQHADSIKSKVESKKYQSDIDGVISRLDNQSTLIQQNESDIELRAEKTYVDDVTDSLEKSLSQINVKYNEISATVSNIRIGSRNIIPDSDLTQRKNTDKWTTVGNTSFTATSPVKYEGFNKSFARVSIPASGIGYNARIRTAYNVSLNEGQTYTLSFIAASSDWVSSDFNYTAILRPNGTFQRTLNLDREKIGEASIGGFNKSIYKYYVTFVHTLESGDNYSVMFGSKTTRDSSAYFVITEPMLENGTMVSDWQPAIEDMDQRMSIAESSITQLEDDITLKVDRDNVVSQININPEGIRLDGALIELNGLALIRDAVIGTAALKNASITKAKLGTAIIDTAHVINGAITNAKIASLNADKINAASLSAISANLGTVTAGIMRSSNENFYLNLNTGSFEMKRSKFKLGSGADIEFEHYGNKLYYGHKDPQSTWTRYSGVGVGRALNDRYPYAYLGTTAGSGLSAKDDDYFTGFITNTNARMNDDEIGNSVVGNIFQIRDKSVSFSKGFTFDLKGNRVQMYGISTGTYSYDLGKNTNRLDRVWVNTLRSPKDFAIINSGETDKGWRIETNFSGDGHGISLYPLYTGRYNYNIGKSTNKLMNVYTQNVRTQRVIQRSSIEDKKLISDVDLEMAYDLIKSIEPKAYFYEDDEVLSTNPSNSGYYKGRKVGFILEDVQALNTNYKYYLMDAEEEGLDNQNFITLLWQASRQIINTLGLSPDSLTFGGDATFEGDIKASKITGSSFRTESSNSHLDIDAASIKANTVLDPGSGSGGGTDSLLTIHGQMIQLHERVNGEIISISPGSIFLMDSGGDSTTISGSTINTHTVMTGNIFQNNGNYLYLGANNEVRATDTNTYTAPITYVPMRAKSFPTGTSLRENKTDIEVFERDVLSEIKETNAYLYRLKGDEKNLQKQLGLMVDETPRILHGEAGDSMEMYALGTYVYRGVQQLAMNDEKQDGRLTDAEVEIQMLKDRIKQLEESK